MRDPHSLSAPITQDDVALVRELLAAARYNGYPMEQHTAHEIAIDLNRYAAEVETWSHEYLVQVVRAATTPTD